VINSVRINKYACNYAVVRFLPYPETDEFVNIGVVMACAQTGMFDYKIETRRRERITGFFPELDVATLLEGRKAFVREVERVKTALNKQALPEQRSFAFKEQEFVSIFRELVKPRESVFRFSGIGTVLTDQPERKLRELFDYYVERQFAQHEEYQETVMTRRLTAVFKAEHIYDRYHPKCFGNELYHVTMPFVQEENDRARKAIKPLDLDKRDSTCIIEYGDKWQRRIERLRDMADFPAEMLFVVRQPAGGRKLDAAAEVCRELEALQVATLNEHDRDAVLQFAKAS
jgi:hypothetical protein